MKKKAFDNSTPKEIKRRGKVGRSGDKKSMPHTSQIKSGLILMPRLISEADRWTDGWGWVGRQHRGGQPGSSPVLLLRQSGAQHLPRKACCYPLESMPLLFEHISIKPARTPRGVGEKRYRNTKDYSSLWCLPTSRDRQADDGQRVQYSSESFPHQNFISTAAALALPSQEGTFSALNVPVYWEGLLQSAIGENCIQDPGWVLLQYSHPLPQGKKFR